MKTTLITAFCLLISIEISAQVPRGVLALEDLDFNSYYLNSGKIPIVNGKILNLSPKEYSKLLISYSIVTPFYDFQIRKTTNVLNDGSFSLQLDYPFPYQQIWLSIGDTLYTCLYANSDLSIELDAAKVDRKNGIEFNGAGLRFLGTDGEITSFMNNHILFKRKQQLELSQEIRALKIDGKLPYNEFILKYNTLYSKLQAIDDEFIKANSSKYAWMIENERTSHYFSDLFSKLLNTKMDAELWEKVKTHKCYSVSNESMTFYRGLLSYISISAGKFLINDWNSFAKYSKIDENGKNLIDSMTYYQKTSNLKSYNKLAGKAFATFSDTLAAIRTLKTIKFIDTTFTPAKADYLKIKMGSMDQNEQLNMYEIISKNLTTNWCKKVVNSEYQKIKDRSLAVETILQQSKPIDSKRIIGNPIAELPFGATLYSVNDVKASELLANIKNSFIGKSLLMDFWATWCGPCLNEMPHSIKLQNDAKELPIEFIYLCTSNNSTLDKWKSKIAELKIPGTHIFVEESIETELMNLFSTKGYPSYVLINSKGQRETRFIRPSATDLKTLNNLLTKK